MSHHRSPSSGPVQDARREFCPWCGASDLAVGPGSGPHFASLTCRDCRRVVKWLGRPIDRESAASFVMPFGTHKGVPMGELPHGYLRWLADNVGGRIAERAELLLEEASS